MQDTPPSTQRTRPLSVASHRSVSPYPYTPVSPRPDSGAGLKQHRQNEARRARQETRTPPVVTIRNATPSPGPQDQEPRSSTDRRSESFESFYTYGEPRGTLVQQRHVQFTDSPTSGTLSPYQTASTTFTQSTQPSGSGTRRSGTDSPRTRDPALTADESVGTYPSRGQRSRSESDNRKYTNSGQHISSPSRLMPMRRGYSESPIGQSSYARSPRLAPASIPDIRQIVEIEGQSQRRAPASLAALPPGAGPPRRTREQRSSPQEIDPDPSQTVQSQAQRLVPLRRAVEEDPTSVPIRTSSMVSVLPRLSSILGRHSRFHFRDVSADVNGYLDERPPSYESLSPRRGLSQASQQAQGNVRPSLLPESPNPASS